MSNKHPTPSPAACLTLDACDKTRCRKASGMLQGADLRHSRPYARRALHAPVARGYGVAQPPRDGVLVHSAQHIDVTSCSIAPLLSAFSGA